MKSLDSNLQCPSCQGALRPKLLGCDDCGIKMEGPFQLNEFATLDGEDLHFLRIFVHAEGRIRDMESALGLSYPTIRTRLGALKNKLAEKADLSKNADANGGDSKAALILERLQAGEISFDDAMAQLKKTRV